MTYEKLDAYCLSKPGTRATYPFDETARVYKVLDKMFALIPEDADSLRINLKCDPDDALALRALYQAIIPGYHMNKQHWNTVLIDGSLPNDLLFELIDHSYDLVVAKMSKAKQQQLSAMKKGHLD
ncbi:MAG: MmcQ/YjbR family DNA-binding protein [Anaerolineales bacterium]|nr:MmcQ/YjbR family DNA-binding protein [Anaerolineales bacterium]